MTEIPGPSEYPEPYGNQPPAGPRNGLGTAALVLAIAGLATALTVAGGVACGMAAVVLGFLGYGRVKHREADNGAVAIAGIVLGALAVIAGIACTLIYVNIWKTVGGSDYFHCMTEAGSDSRLQQQCADQFHQRLNDKFGPTAGFTGGVGAE
jgi:hypothetical protein